MKVGLFNLPQSILLVPKYYADTSVSLSQYFVCHPPTAIQAFILAGILAYKLSNYPLSNVSHAALIQDSSLCLAVTYYSALSNEVKYNT